jgi:clan AA aspartic protease (TIGR02281 family)
MRRQLSRAALALGALLLDPIAGGRYAARDLEDVRLERLSVPTIESEPAPAILPTDRTADDIPLSGDRRHLIVNGTLNGTVTGPLLIDTGASYCVITRKTARRLGVVPRHSGRTIPVATANGRVDADLVGLDAIQIEQARLAGVDAVIMDAVEPPLIGIIGLNFLTEFRFSVDLAQGTMRLEP